MAQLPPVLLWSAISSLFPRFDDPRTVCSQGRGVDSRRRSGRKRVVRHLSHFEDQKLRLSYDADIGAVVRLGGM
jgi:transposase